MENENNTEVASESKMLSAEQIESIENREEGTTVQEALNNTKEETVLESEKTELPEKYAGKSAEEVFRLMNIENEYKANQNNNTETNEETKTEETPERLETIKEFTKKVQENGGEFSEEMYNELLEKGISKEEADLTKAGIEAKNAETVDNLFKSAETSREDFTEAGNWAKENWSKERVAEYNEAVDAAFKSGNEVIQKTLIRSLTEAFNNGKETSTETYHSNNTYSAPKVEGYSNKTEYFKDQRNPAYKKDASYRAMVEDKFFKTDKSKW